MNEYYDNLTDDMIEKIYDIFKNKKEDYDSLMFLGNVIEFYYEEHLIELFEDFDTEQDINYQFKIFTFYYT